MAKARGYKAGDFSYNTGKLRCPTREGTPDEIKSCEDSLTGKYI